MLIQNIKAVLSKIRYFYKKSYIIFINFLNKLVNIPEMFHIVLYNSHIFETETKWMGVSALKCPFDLWVYQEIMFETQPDYIIECGVNKGGTTLFLASICDLLGKGEIIGIDINLAVADHKVANHPRVHLIEGSSIDPLTIKMVDKIVGGNKCNVILDSNHTKEHVLRELRAYSRFVQPRGFLICEDSNINGHPVLPNFGPGPTEAILDFISKDNEFYIDKSREKFLVTFNPNGFLKRKE